MRVRVIVMKDDKWTWSVHEVPQYDECLDLHPEFVSAYGTAVQEAKKLGDSHVRVEIMEETRFEGD
jgi:hypothetical protein